MVSERRMVNWRAVAQRIAALRKARQWSQGDLAQAARLQQPHISLIETGQRELAGDTLIGLAEAFGITIDELLKVDAA